MRKTSNKQKYQYVNFDINTIALKEMEIERKGVYSDIREFMEKNGFERRQYSGYLSKEKRLTSQNRYLFKKMKKNSNPFNLYE